MVYLSNFFIIKYKDVNIMTYGEIIDRERPRNIKDIISKDEKEIMKLYKESDKQRLINESSTGYEINTNHFMKVDEFNMSGLTGAIQIC